MANSGVDPKTSEPEHHNNGQCHYVQLGDLRMYYEIHGSGKPLVLLGGGFMTVEAMGQILEPLSQSRQVIAAERQGHGHTADIAGRPLSYTAMADDIATLIKSLGLDSADRDPPPRRGAEARARVGRLVPWTVETPVELPALARGAHLA